MHFREHEYTVKTIRRHLTPFLFTILKTIIVSLPFYIIVHFIGKNISTKFLIWAYFIVSLVVGFFIIYIAITYILDRLVITNERIVFVNWHSFWRKDEFETNLQDIQDIRTRERGFLARFRFLDYGLLEIQTASSSATIVFDKAPDPEAIKTYILSILKKGKVG